MSEEKIFDPEADLEENKRKVVGACPKCGSDVYDYGWGWACSKGRDVCNFKENKTVLGHQITDEEFETLSAQIICGGESRILYQRTIRCFRQSLS